MPPAQVAVFAENVRERSFRAGESIFRRGEMAESYHVIVEGSVHARGAEFLDGRTLTTRESFGFLNMLASDDDLEAVAETDTVTLELACDTLHEILEDDFSLVHRMIRNLAKQTLDVRRRIPTGTYLAPMEGQIRPPDRPLDLVERLIMIRRPGSPFASASLDAMTRIARATEEVHLDPGTRIWRTGDRSEYVFIIVSGVVACTTQWGASRFEVGPGYPLGNLERFTGDPRWYTAVTKTPVVALQGDTESLLDILEDHFDLAIGLVSSMAKRVIDIRREADVAR
jgi:CRP-like cAMP-binding protein